MKIKQEDNYKYKRTMLKSIYDAKLISFEEYYLTLLDINEKHGIMVARQTIKEN